MARVHFEPNLQNSLYSLLAGYRRVETDDRVSESDRAADFVQSNASRKRTVLDGTGGHTRPLASLSAGVHFELQPAAAREPRLEETGYHAIYGQDLAGLDEAGRDAIQGQGLARSAGASLSITVANVVYSYIASIVVRL